MIPPSTIPAIALDLFRQRQSAARKMVAAGKWSLPEAEARLAPWAALAAACGADLPELRYESRPVYPYDRAGQVEPSRWHSSEICPREAMLAELTQATRAALDADWRSPASQSLLALYLHFHLVDRTNVACGSMPPVSAGPTIKEAA